MEQILVTQPTLPDYEEYCEEIKAIWASRWLTNMGKEHQMLQSRLEEFLGCPHLVLFTNGHLALEYMIASMHFPAGSEVITTPFTFASTTHAIVRNSLTPVFCDVNKDDYTIDAEKIESLITEKTVAILPVHVYGNLCDVEKIRAVADAHGLKVLYDAAHAFAVKYKGVSAVNFGDASMLSFHATKVYNTIEGGAVCTADGEIAETLTAMKNFGMREQDDFCYAGGNAKMSEFQAAMGLCNLRHLEGEIAKRRAVVERYRANLAGIPGIRLCKEQPEVESNYAYFPVVFDGFAKNRDEVFCELQEKGISARRYFYPLTNSFSCYADLPTADPEKTPVAKHLADRVLTLPLYPDLPLEDVDRICAVITG